MLVYGTRDAIRRLTLLVNTCKRLELKLNFENLEEKFRIHKEISFPLCTDVVVMNVPELNVKSERTEMKTCPEIITLDNSDGDDNDAPALMSRNVGATASIIRSKPLSFSALQPKRSVVDKQPPHITTFTPSQFCEVNALGTSATLILQGTSSLSAHPKYLRLEPRDLTVSNSGIDNICTISSSLRKENSLDSYCFESYDPKAPPFEAQQFIAKFRCSVGKCRMTLSNNVSFMFHLWAHLTEFSCGNGINCPREMHRFCRCPQCLHLFPTPYRLQIHYDNVHSATPSSSTCKICEITVEEAYHFVRFHSNTRSLLCPFCLFCYVIPRDNTSSVICEREYVKHFLLHQEENYNCDQCSLKFIRHTDKIAHRREHTQPNLKWISKTIQVRTRRKGRKLWSKKKWKCVECNQELNNVCDHFKRIAQLLSSLVVCNRCKRASCIERDILNHVRNCSGGRCVVINLKQERSNIVSHYNDELEMKIFALRPQEEVRRPDHGDIAPNLYNFLRRDQNSLSPSLVEANIELNNARLHIL
uniref:C2H2-type domain-containing protein n=1 Tax=Setaria digitata TaxID=48799 RepID=A0A915Q105_9BILA